MKRLKHIFWLGIKELRSLSRDKLIIALLIWAFTVSVFLMAKGTSLEVHNASIAFVDEDQSNLSRELASAFYPPNFLKPDIINASELDNSMDRGHYMFVINIPPRFESDVREGKQPEIQVDIDATAVLQANIGAHYIQSILTKEVGRYVQRPNTSSALPVKIIARTAFNPNRTTSWFNGIVAMIDRITMLTIILTGAALIREREHGTIEHLLVMPLTAFDIAMSKVWANSAVLLVAVALCMYFIILTVLEVPVAGSIPLFMAGVVLYLFFATAMGILLGTIARSMAQFALLFTVFILVVTLLSGGTTPVESQPDWLQNITWLLPSRHFISASQGILFRGAGFDAVWPQFAIVTGLGVACFLYSLRLFRKSLTSS